MVAAARYAFAILAWAFLVGLVLQVFLIGLALFADESAIQTHQQVGWILHLVPILIVLAAILARAGRRRVLPAVALAVIVFILPLLPALRESSSVVAALHPVLALLAFGSSLGVAMSATRLLRGGAGAAPERAATA